MRAYVLAGGRSSRMGVDKARLPEDGWPVAIRLCERLERAGLNPHIVRRGRDDLPWTFPDGRSAEVVLEGVETVRHPLQGVLTAARDAHAPFMVVPCDLWRVTSASLRELAARGVRSQHPLLGVFDSNEELLADWIREGRSARSYPGRPVFPVDDLELVDRNHGGGPWPPEQLAERLQHVARLDRASLLAGERERLRKRGVVVP